MGKMGKMSNSDSPPNVGIERVDLIEGLDGQLPTHL